MKPLAQFLSFAVILMAVCMANGGCGGSTPAPPTPSPPPQPTITSISPAGMAAVIAINGPITVTINGTNFENDATVNWSGQPSTAKFVNDTQLLVQFPPSPNFNIPSQFVVFKVTVVNPSSAVSNAVDFTYQILI